MPLERFTDVDASLLKRQSGITLLELALGLMILCVLSVGVSSLVKTGVETQLAQRTEQEMQTIGMNIVDDLRHDIRTADRATVSNGNNTLSLFYPAGRTVTYKLESNKGIWAFSREDNKLNPGNPKVYNSGQMNQLNVNCAAGGCFKTYTPAGSSQVRQVIVDELVVSQPTPKGGGTVIDNAFATPNFRLRDFSFEILSATEFK